MNLRHLRTKLRALQHMADGARRADHVDARLMASHAHYPFARPPHGSRLAVMRMRATEGMTLKESIATFHGEG